MLLDNKTILITGGTGSFGKCFTRYVFTHYNPKKVIVYSRDEFKQFIMQNEFREYADRLRFFIGDVRDKERLERAFEGVDYVIHAAALKQVPTCEYNPNEAIKTNIHGAQNVIDAALDSNVKKVVALSTDKAVNPVNLYGGTKLVSDKLFIAANAYAGTKDINFSIVRYGNVAGSRGSIIPLFHNIIKNGGRELPITDYRMTRFWISLTQGVELVIKALEEATGGETFISKIPSFKVTDLAKAMLPGCEMPEIGIRPGEKLHEIMVTVEDSHTTYEYDRHFIVYPQVTWNDKQKINTSGRKVEEGFSYSSGNNKEWLGVEDIQKLLKEVELENKNMDIRVTENNLAQALALHRENPVVDAHLDLAGEILLRHQAGEEDVIRRHYLSDFKKAGIRLVVSSVFVENDNLKDGWQNALKQIAALKKEVSGLDELTFIESSRDLEQLLKGEKIGILLYMEGLDCIGEDIDRINELFKLGVRGASLTWSRPNALAVGCCKAAEHRQIFGPLTEAGVRAVKRLEELSMFVDVSHLNDDGFEDLCRIAERSFIATHSGSRYIFDSYRNLTDDQMRRLSAQGGVMGMNGCQCIAGSLLGNHLEMLCRHIEYKTAKLGAEHVGYGFDLCDSYDQADAALKGTKHVRRNDCLLNHGQVPLVSAALLQRGMDEESVKKIMGGNFLCYFRSILPGFTT